MILYSLIISPIEYIIENLFSFFYIFLQFDILSTLFFISLFVTLFSLPFYYKADKIHKEEEEKFSQIKPYVDRIKKNFKGDEQFFLLQTLYRQHNYNPIMALRNFFSLLLQIPFFIAAYHFFSNLELLNGYSISFFKDLSKPDNFLCFSGIYINVLPIIMTIINIISSEIYIKSVSLKERIQSYGLALFFFVVLYNSPSGLVLYWTFNNFFYLIKNMYMDKSLKKYFSILTILGLFVYSINFIRNYYPENGDFSSFISLILYTILIIIFASIFLFYLYKYSKDILEKQNNLFNNISKEYLIIIFFICGLGLVFLQGLIIPIKLLISDLQAFILDPGMTNNIIEIIAYNLLSFTGLYLFWGGITLYFINNKYRIYFIIIFLSIFLFSLFNYITFPKDIGIISADLVFENIKVFEENFVNTINQFINGYVFLLIVILVTYALKKSMQKSIIFVILSLLFSEFIISSIYTYNFIKDINLLNIIHQNNKKYSKNTNKIELSKSGKNVIIIFLDKFVGALLPIIIDEKPELKNTYSGFTYYPNTISFYRYTILGYPPIVGGYVYTPFALNKDKRKFSDKWLEANLMLPTLFKSNNYISTVVDPIGDFDLNMRFSKDVDFATIYKSKGINYLKMCGQYNSDFYINKNMNIINRYTNILKKKLYIYSFFSISATVCKNIIYDDGMYLLARKYREYDSSEHQFLSAYVALYYLNKVTTLNDSDKTFTLINNGLPHFRSYYLNSTTYEYSKIVKDISPNKFNDETSLMSYNSAMASLLLVGKYLDYLKQLGVYDNSRIIIVSDHGNSLLKIPQYSDFININAIPLNALLMVKDFNQNNSLKANNSFMTNADVPYLATKDLIDNAQNPFTGNIIKPVNKKDGINVYMNFTYWNASHFTTNKAILEKQPLIKQVKNDIFVDSNWEIIEYENNN
jgi:YidC/Oxa1 family membrane protein insertase